MDDSYRRLAARHIRRQARQLTEQLWGVRRGDDVEFVHRARVASRRLRAALGMFRDCFGARRVKRWRKQIRRMTRELGEARDRDVQIQFLCEALGGLDDKRCVAAVALLLAEIHRKRERLQPRILRAIDRLRSSKVIGQMQSVMKETSAEAASQEAAPPSPFTYAEAEKHVARRVRDLLTYHDCLSDPEAVQQHHAMRIAAKRLRYTVEIVRRVYSGQLDDAIEAVKRIQTLLGDIHDCDVWLSDLDRFGRKLRRRTGKYFGSAGPFGCLEPGIEHLRQDRKALRAQAFGELIAFWRQLQGNEFWKHLLEIVGSSGAGSTPCRTGPEPPVAEPPVSRVATGGNGDRAAAKLNLALPVATAGG